MKNIRFVLMPAMLIVALVSFGGWAIGGNPFDFPSFIPFDIAKTGDVAIDNVGNVFINITDKDGYAQIWKYSPSGKGPFLVAELGEGMAYGLAIDAKGDLYAAVRPGTYSIVYRIDRRGNAVPLPGTDNIVWANSLAFDQRGNLYITESYSLTSTGFGPGGIWRVPPGGVAEPWLQDALLTGVGQAPVGANGIAFYQGDLYVVTSLTVYQSSLKSLVVRVPIRPNGTPGEPEVWSVLQEVPEAVPILGMVYPVMGDGLALDVHGNVYVPVVTRSAVIRIDAENAFQETIATFSLDPDEPLLAPLDAPNMLVFGTGKSERQNLFVTNTGGVKAVLGTPWPGYGLVKIDAGVPGLPLP